VLLHPAHPSSRNECHPEPHWRSVLSMWESHCFYFKERVLRLQKPINSAIISIKDCRASWSLLHRGGTLFLILASLVWSRLQKCQTQFTTPHYEASNASYDWAICISSIRIRWLPLYWHVEFWLSLFMRQAIHKSMRRTLLIRHVSILETRMGFRGDQLTKIQQDEEDGRYVLLFDCPILPLI